MIKIKPCPFCGETQYLDVRESVEWFVSCLNPLCGQMKSTKIEAIKAWNTRHTPSLSDEAILGLIRDYLVPFNIGASLSYYMECKDRIKDFARAVLARAMRDA